MSSTTATEATSVRSLEGSWNRQRKLWYSVAAAILVIALGYSLVMNSREKKRATAATELFSARQQLEKELKIAGTDTVSDVDRQFSGTAQQLRNVVSRFSGTQAAWDAQIQLGNLYLKYEPRGGKAVAIFEAAANSAPTPRERVFAYYALAYAHEAQGHLDDAVRAIEKAVALKLPILKGELAVTRARLLERGGHSTEARQAYDEIVKEFGDTETARRAREWKAQGAS